MTDGTPNKQSNFVGVTIFQLSPFNFQLLRSAYGALDGGSLISSERRAPTSVLFRDAGKLSRLQRTCFPLASVLSGRWGCLMRSSVLKLAKNSVARWLLVGGLFAGVGLGLLELFFGVLEWPYWVATFLQAEICTLLRFLVNDRWVFGQGAPTWKRLWQYHVANAGGFAVWWATANLLQWNGVNYLLSAILAMCCSVGVSLLSNFLWVWRKRTNGTPPHSAV